MNAESVAARHGIRVETARASDAREYASAVTLRADGVEVGATLAAGGHAPRIVSLLGYKIDVAPARGALVFEYVDAPGASAPSAPFWARPANITTMQIGTKPEEGCALVYMNVEGDVTDAVLGHLRDAVADLKNLWHVKL